MRKILSISVILFVASFFVPSYSFSSSSTQKRLSLQQRVQIFCEERRDKEPLCSEHFSTIKKRLEIKGELLLEIEEYCKKNNVKALCRSKDSASITLYCLKHGKNSHKCQEWKEWKRKELELKGKLIETLQAFCKNNPKSRACQN